ncbi:hypothetical protein EC988_000759 [Linderina pennispora]|nr:hypothetical protein EC988_000759 [Linderina pennispora]
MPVIEIVTNVQIEDTKSLSVKASTLFTQLLSIPANFVLTFVNVNPSMTFGGTDEPTALINALYLRQTSCPANSLVIEKLTGLVNTELGVDPKRVFVNLSFGNPMDFGWNGELLALVTSRDAGIPFRR